MRIALISDLHGNELALAAVLEDVERSGMDRIVCLGDVATLGPQPVAVLNRLRELGCACILGNHDEFLLEPSLVADYTDVRPIIDSIAWARAQLGPSELDFVATFARSLEIPLGDAGTLLLFHATPDSNVTDLLATTPAEHVDELLGARRAPLMAGGHTHIQMLRQHRGALLINPGSVGMPFREYVNRREPQVLAHAEYACVEARGAVVSVELRRIALDARSLANAARAVDNPLSPWLASMYAA